MLCLMLRDGKLPSESVVTFEVMEHGAVLVDVFDGTDEGIDLDALAAWGRRCTLAEWPSPPVGWSFYVEAGFDA
jgi:predicted RNA-binding protein